MSGSSVHIVVEGTHGGGKSTAIAQSNIAGVCKIPSLLVPYEILLQLPGDPRAVYYVNDVAKSQVRCLDPNRPTLSDRSFASSLVYAAFVAETSGSKQYFANVRTRIEQAVDSQKLFLADLIIVFDIDPLEAWRRVCARDGGQWTTVDEIEFFQRFYANPPRWFLEIVTKEYLLVGSSSIEANVAAIEASFK